MKCPCGREIDRSIEDQIIAKQSEYYEVAITSVTEQGKIISDLQQKLKDKQSEIERLTAENARLQADLAASKQRECAYDPISESCNRQNEKLSSLTRQLEEGKGEWKTGKPPKDGWYWIDKDSEHTEPAYYCLKADSYFIEPIGYRVAVHYPRWSGPIPQPEAPKC